MKKILFLSVIMLSISLVACNRTNEELSKSEEETKQEPQDSTIEGGGASIHYTSYVYSYHFAKEMYLAKDVFASNYYEWNEHLYSPYGFSVMFEDDYTRTVAQWHKDERKVRFDSLSLKHKDTSFNQIVLSSDACAANPHNYLAFDLLSINVTSNADFDEQHPAGSSLNDVVQFIAYSPITFIKSGYQYTAPESDYLERWKEEKLLINKQLSQCTAADFILILGKQDNSICCDTALPCCYLVVNNLPTLAQQHTLTVTVVGDDNKTWEASIDMDWSGQ